MTDVRTRALDDGRDSDECGGRTDMNGLGGGQTVEEEEEEEEGQGRRTTLVQRTEVSETCPAPLVGEKESRLGDSGGGVKRQIEWEGATERTLESR